MCLRARTVPVIPGRDPASSKVPGSRDRYVEIRIHLEGESELSVFLEQKNHGTLSGTWQPLVRCRDALTANNSFSTAHR
ncbi:hypothetical protein LMH87_003767 [Akanthomyces muscarius]|uniref:Uncharacterized protein n=1 Tax=Akanthomyces muscarius TaxID=2231603 RepID=A0A9W8UHE6_AKAMU|nr:hypothetical protein LMH87_003767 [Akanthomyces muscarius]KAJ4144899.1 hypothetical protein LMH87_003767 [Akanthomyces muscarius]